MRLSTARVYALIYRPCSVTDDAAGRDRASSGEASINKEESKDAHKPRQVKSWLAVQGMRVNGDSVTLSEGIKVPTSVQLSQCAFT